jgi:hypothetical protein
VASERLPNGMIVPVREGLYAIRAHGGSVCHAVPGNCGDDERPPALCGYYPAQWWEYPPHNIPWHWQAASAESVTCKRCLRKLAASGAAIVASRGRGGSAWRVIG